MPGDASGSIRIPLSERRELLDSLGALDVAFGEERTEAHKSNFFFRTAEQVSSTISTNQTGGERNADLLSFLPTVGIRMGFERAQTQEREKKGSHS